MADTASAPKSMRQIVLPTLRAAILNAILLILLMIERALRAPLRRHADRLKRADQIDYQI